MCLAQLRNRHSLIPTGLVRKNDGDTMLSFIDVFDPARYYPVCLSLVDALDNISMLRLCMTCRTMRSLYECVHARQWDINRPLARFVEDPYHLRHLMKRANAIISGHLALQFFYGEYFPETGMDIFAPYSAYMVDLVQYFVEIEGYSAKSSCPATWCCPDTFCSGCSSNKFKMKTFTQGDRVIRLAFIRTWTNPVKFILASFYGSAVMNFITYSKAYSVFPKATFVKRQMCILKRCGDLEERALLKYEGRGFTAVPMEIWKRKPASELREFVCARKIGDRHTWTIDLDNPWEHPDANRFECTRFSATFNLEHAMTVLDDVSPKQDHMSLLKAHARPSPLLFLSGSANSIEDRSHL
ncbi:conserved hypothetical protein [Coccidioides posadasii str. Silveira]|uniref:Uncharacterized protein n=1 Tax=Coccidioides posadasii (strain RMSCC 757 / Silveira) TaxID=443226 RepID=E9CW56_COCPS|nr:conserved hypothetical protein [Coccidioides posadasii str. Silveira]